MADNAVIYIYRPQSLVAIIQAFSIHVDDNFIGLVRNGSFFRVVVPPGSHKVFATPLRVKEDEDSLTIKRAEAGMMYYVRLELESSVTSGIPELSLGTAREAQAAIRNLDLLVEGQETDLGLAF